MGARGRQRLEVEPLDCDKLSQRYSTYMQDANVDTDLAGASMCFHNACRGRQWSVCFTVSTPIRPDSTAVLVAVLPGAFRSASLTS